MLNKRLYKKLSFVVIIAVIPLLVILFSTIAKDDSGFVHIVLAQTDKNDAISSQVVDELMNEDSIIRFSYVDSADEAIEYVKTGKADEAWIFNDNLQEKINNFTTSKADSVAVNVVAREQTVFLRVANEKLSATMYKHYAKAYYINFVRENLSMLDSLSDEELMQYFDNINLNEDLFVFASPADTSNADVSPNTDYLTSPIRGLLGVLIVLCGMAAVMFFMQDEKFGTFSWVKQNHKLYVAFACVIIACLNVSIVGAISLLCAGLSQSIAMELVGIILYPICVSVFCLLLKQIFENLKLYSSMLPIVTVIMIAVCPIFFDFRNLRILQMLLPPTYYVNMMYDNIYVLYMVVYIAVGFALSLLLNSVKEKRFLRKSN